MKIFVASHKPYSLPSNDLYIPIEVGADSREDLLLGGVRDNTGDNISNKNPNYCELTALYWIWKNYPNEEPVGLAHYRRHFRGKQKNKDIYERILTRSELTELLKDYPVVLPPKRNYFIETVRNQYIHAHHAEDLTVLEEVIRQEFPDYLPAFNKVMQSTSTHILNMFVMRRELFDSYCQWLFPLLFKVEEKLDISSYSKNDARVFGFLSERLLDVWLLTNQIPYKEIPILNLEKVNWPKKISRFLLRKFGIKPD